MSEERESLAAQAAAWIPPWDRTRPSPPDDVEPAADPAPADPDDVVEPVATADLAEAAAKATDDAAPAEPMADSDVSANVGADFVAPAGAAEESEIGHSADHSGTVDAEPTNPDQPAPVSSDLDLALSASAAADGEEPPKSDMSASGEADSVRLNGAARDSEIGNSADHAETVDAEPTNSDQSAPVPSALDPDLDLATPPPVPSALDPDLDPDPDPSSADALALIDEGELVGALEAILLVVDEPVQEIVLAQIMEQPTERVVAALEAVAASYTEHGHGFELRRAAGGWRLYTRPQYAAYVQRFVLDGQSARLTQAALETLAVIAYKQPVTRSRISVIRGVNCDGVIRTLTSRGLVEECGTEPDSGAYLYRTTTLFLEKLGLDSVNQLPPLAPFLPDDIDEVADAGR